MIHHLVFYFSIQLFFTWKKKKKIIKRKKGKKGKGATAIG